MDDLAQSPTACQPLRLFDLSITVEVLTISFGCCRPSDARLITFNLDKAEPRIPPFIAFQIPVTMKKRIVHRCIIDEGASTRVMSANVWKKLGSPDLVPSTIHWGCRGAYDGRPSQLEGLDQNFPIELARSRHASDMVWWGQSRWAMLSSRPSFLFYHTLLSLCNPS